jgi:hypothetical protein
MPKSPYAEEVQTVQRAIARLKEEPDTSLAKELEEEQLAAGTSLEWYGITKCVFEGFLESRELSMQTRNALKEAINAVRVIFTSPNLN